MADGFYSQLRHVCAIRGWRLLLLTDGDRHSLRPSRLTQMQVVTGSARRLVGQVPLEDGVSLDEAAEVLMAGTFIAQFSGDPGDECPA